jgi:hypothetical protein
LKKDSIYSFTICFTHIGRPGNFHRDVCFYFSNGKQVSLRFKGFVRPEISNFLRELERFSPPEVNVSIDSKCNLCDVCIANVGETYHRTVPYTGWSIVPKGAISFVNPWQLEYFLLNPYDKHPYSELSNNTYQRDLFLKNPTDVYYRIVDGYKYTGEYTDSTDVDILTERGIKIVKEIYFKGKYKDGLLDGWATFYFTSKDNYAYNANLFQILKLSSAKLGEIKAQGQFKNGKMVGKWTYYGYKIDFSRVQSGGDSYCIIEKRDYDKDNK